LAYRQAVGNRRRLTGRRIGTIPVGDVSCNALPNRRVADAGRGAVLEATFVSEVFWHCTLGPADATYKRYLDLIDALAELALQ
jgi:hypothetical protein